MGKEYSDLDSLELQENSKMLIISILGIAILFVADLYVMINNPGNFVVFSIITILMLVWIFIFTRQMVKFQQQKRKKETEHQHRLDSDPWRPREAGFEGLFTAEKSV